MSRPSEVPHPAPDGDREDQAVYLFALVEACAVLPSARVADGPFEPPRLYRAGPVGAVVSLVPLADFCGADAAQHLADPAWVGPRAVQHAAILSGAMQCSPVFPVPFGTLYANLASLSAFMLAHRDGLARFFATVAGMEEWGLTASARLHELDALERTARRICPLWGDLSPGVRYLQLCRDRPRLMAAHHRQAGETARSLAARLQQDVAAMRPLAPPAGGGRSAEPVARFALLVPVGRRDALAERVGQLARDAAEEGLSLSLSGPWPPFSFRPDLPDLRTAGPPRNPP